MTKKQLLIKLKKINEDYKGDIEECHYNKDKALLEYIDDKDIKEEFFNSELWYA